ncbi:bestrophin family ion channel [Microcoleus sp. MON1_C1]|uniref:bestrophin family ion channel n=1 Tax=unclassified Microcoleus TaxID=2642155 RepID=UPI002FD26989
MSRDRPPWFKIALQVRGSVIPSILPRVLLCGGFGVIISLLHFFNWPVSMPILSSIVPSIVLGLLLVFRTNTAYERFWEGRRFWGTLNNNIRNLARQIWVAIEEKDPQDIIEKKSALRLLVALAVAMKLHLRQESVNPELEPLMSPAQYQKLKSMNNPPLEIAFWIEDYMHEQYERNCLDVYQLTGMNELLNSMIDVLGGCERILKTPIPLAYAIHLKQLLLLYCLALPFQMVKDLGWGTGPVVALISFTLFGIEEIGIEIENPFGHDANDLPLDNMCAAMQRNMDDLISLSPSVHEHVKDK